MSQYGTPTSAYLIGGRPLVFADPAWLVLNVLALAATVVTASVVAGVFGAYLRRCRRSGRNPVSGIGTPAGILVLFVAATFAGLTLYGSKSALFDRYFWPVVVPLATLLWSPPPTKRDAEPRRKGSLRPTVALGIASWAVLLSVSVLYMLNSFAFDVARWQSGNRLVSLGIRPEAVDAGYEWVGEHQPELPAPNPPLGSEVFYDNWWPGRAACGIVAGSLSDGPALLVDVFSWNLFLIAGPSEKLYLYRRSTEQCSPSS
jgi:hypothetical protein